MMEGDVERVFCSICNDEFGSINPAVKVGEAGLTPLVKRAKEIDNKELYKIFEAKLNQEIVENVDLFQEHGELYYWSNVIYL